MRTIDLTPFRRSTVGFDRLFDWLETGTVANQPDTYPPFDVEQEGEDRYRITLAVAGFRRDEIDITANQNLLTVSGRKSEEADRRVIHRGIATRSFERSFVLGDYVQVRGAELQDGLLSIELVREVPEQMKPRKIEISGDHSGRLTDQRTESEVRERQAA